MTTNRIGTRPTMSSYQNFSTIRPRPATIEVPRQRRETPTVTGSQLSALHDTSIWGEPVVRELWEQPEWLTIPTLRDALAMPVVWPDYEVEDAHLADLLAAEDAEAGTQCAADADLIAHLDWETSLGYSAPERDLSWSGDLPAGLLITSFSAIPLTAEELEAEMARYYDDSAITDPRCLAALAYADAGIRVIWLRRHDKNPARTLGKGWKKQATRDRDLIKTWWRRHPGANIALVPPRGVLILDVDCKNGSTGRQDYDAIVELLGHLPLTAIAITPSGGFHIWLRMAPGTTVATNTAAVKKLLGHSLGWDLKSGESDHCVVAPGSSLLETKKWRAGDYKWLVALPDLDTSMLASSALLCSPDGCLNQARSLAEAPAAWLDLVRCEVATAKVARQDTEQTPSVDVATVANLDHLTHVEEEMVQLCNKITNQPVAVPAPRSPEPDGSAKRPLPESTIAALRYGITMSTSSDQTPSAMFWGVLGSMRNCGWSYAEAQAELSLESNAGTWLHVSKDGESPEQVTTLLNKEIENHRRKFRAAATGPELHPEFDALLIRIENTHTLNRVGGATDREVWSWCVREARKLGNTKISASSRSIAADTHIKRQTVSLSLHRLMAHGELGNAGHWRRIPQVIVRTSALMEDQTAQETSSATLSTEHGRSEAFAYRALGATVERLIRELHKGSGSAAQLAKRTGVSPSTMSRQLHRMEWWTIAYEANGSWHLADKDLGHILDLARQRNGSHHYLETRRALMASETQGRMEWIKEQDEATKKG